MGEMLHMQGIVLKALFRMRTAVTDPGVKEALASYEKLVKEQTGTLTKIYAASEILPKEKKCDGMMGVLLKGQQFMLRSGAGPSLDAALLSICSKVASYKAASLSSLASWARFCLPDETRGARLLDQVTQREKEALERFEKLVAKCDEQK